MNKALKEAKKLKDEILELRLKFARKEKQRKHWRRRFKNLDNHEFRNILKIKAKKIVDESFLDIVDDDFFLLNFFPWALTNLFNSFIVEILEVVFDNSQNS